MDAIKRFLARFLSGPLFLIVGFYMAYEWAFEGVYWTVASVPISPILIVASVSVGLWLTKLGYIDNDVDKILDFL